MSNRIYNVIFHTHTVSGLVISVALFVIFFAGSISFFRDDIIAWERNQPISANSQMEVDFDQVLDTLSSRYGSLQGRNINIRQGHQERNVLVSIDASKDTLAADSLKQSVFTYLDTSTYKEESYYSSYTLGEFIYRLHFFAQISYPYGYLLSGFVAFFFLFAIITGVIVHWKKIISNFYVFRPWAKLKTVWTDAHTALGLIGLPFQFVFAVTGAVLIIGTTILLAFPSSLVYQNNRDLMYRELMDLPDPFEFTGVVKEIDPNLNEKIARSKETWADVLLSRVAIENYGDENMHVIIEARPKPESAFIGLDRIIFNSNGEIVEQTNETSTTYVVAADQTIRRLHFGDFGGYGLKIVYCVFGFITCFVIISGVLIWVEARNKKSTDSRKRKANDWVARIFLAISLSLYPVTTFTFCVIKTFPYPADSLPHVFIYQVYFISWLVGSILLSIRGSYYLINKYCLITGAFFGFLVPLANGMITNNWLWTTFNEQKIQVFAVDAFWLCTSFVAVLVLLKIEKS